jgi:hypothetical protein
MYVNVSFFQLLNFSKPTFLRKVIQFEDDLKWKYKDGDQ